MEIRAQTYVYELETDGETVIFCSNAPASPNTTVQDYIYLSTEIQSTVMSSYLSPMALDTRLPACMHDEASINQIKERLLKIIGNH